MSGPGSVCYGGKATSTDWGKFNNTLTTVMNKLKVAIALEFQSNSYTCDK